MVAPPQTDRRRNDDRAARGSHRAGTALAALPVVAATLLLSAAATGDGVLPGDVAVARWIQGAPQRPGGDLARFAYWVGSMPALVTGAIALALAFVVARRYAAAAFVLAAGLLRVVNPGLKQAIDSPRPPPELVRVTEQASGLGFPSGHAMGVALVIGAVILAARRADGPRGLFHLVAAAGLGLVVVTGFGRVYTGAHWPSDVLGGYLWAATALVALTTTISRIDAAQGRRRPGTRSAPR